MKYDYLIVGAGFFGSVCARELTDKGYKCLVIEKRNHIAGNCYTEDQNGITVHKYGAHIFHTSNEKIWDYVNRFSKFRNIVHKVKVNYKGEIYPFPITKLVFQKLYGDLVDLDKIKIPIDAPKNLEEWCLSMVGKDIYEIYFKGYTQKQWGSFPVDLPISIIKRIPIRYNSTDDSYYNDKYQGIPISGYTGLIQKMLAGIEVRVNIDYFSDKNGFNSMANNIIYGGSIDQFFNYLLGRLEYRSLQFKEEVLNTCDFQGNSVVNYTDETIPYTRIVEHKHFLNQQMDIPMTIITKEYPTFGGDPMYPIEVDKNLNLYKKYEEMGQSTNVIFGGRLGSYKYYDMHHVVANALKLCDGIKVSKN